MSSTRTGTTSRPFITRPQAGSHGARIVSLNGDRPVSVTRLDDIEPIAVAGVRYQPLRRALGVRAFGINAYSASAAGDQLIEHHDEVGFGAGGQEEAYIVTSGRATFTVDDEEIDAPAGTIVFVPNVASKRSAVAAEEGTAAIVVGAPADNPIPTSPFEYWFVAKEPYHAGNYERAIEIVSEGFEEWPDHPILHYELACYHALAGQRDEALDHLEQAASLDERMKKWAAGDRDFDPIREHPRFTAAVK